MDLNNFYQDYAFNPDDFKLLSEIYSGIASDLMKYMIPLQDNRIARYIEDFRIVPTQYIDISSAQYDIESVLSGEELEAYYHAELKDKIQILRDNQKYIRIVADRQLIPPSMTEGNPIDESISETNNTIVNFNLVDPDQDNKPLIAGIHYVFEDNRLYMIGDYALPFDDARSPFYEGHKGRSSVLKMSDIAVDFDTVSDILGKNLELDYQPTKIPKVEFNDFVRELTLAAIKGFQLSDVRDGLNQLESITGKVEIFDRKTEDPVRAAMWENQNYRFSPFDFVVYFPEDLDYYRVSLLSQYLHKVRHKYTSFQTVAYGHFEEAYNVDRDGDHVWFDHLWINDAEEYILYLPDDYFTLNDASSLLNSADRLLMARFFHVATNGLPVETFSDNMDNLMQEATDGYSAEEQMDMQELQAEVYEDTSKVASYAITSADGNAYLSVDVVGVNLLNAEIFQLGKSLYGGGGGGGVGYVNNAYAMSTTAFAVKPNTNYTILNFDTDIYWVDRACELSEDGICTYNHAWYAGGRNGKYYNITTKADTVAIMIRVMSVDHHTLTQSDIENLRVMLVEGKYSTTTMPEYEPYLSAARDAEYFEVVRYSKNIFNPSKLIEAGWTESDGVYAGYPSRLHEMYFYTVGTSLVENFAPNTQYILSFTIRTDMIDGEYKRGMIFTFRYEDGTRDSITIDGSEEAVRYHLVSTAGKTILGLYTSYAYNPKTYLSDIQLEMGYQETEYEPYGTLIENGMVPIDEAFEDSELTLTPESIVSVNFYRQSGVIAESVLQNKEASGYLVHRHPVKEYDWYDTISVVPAEEEYFIYKLNATQLMTNDESSLTNTETSRTGYALSDTDPAVEEAYDTVIPFSGVTKTVSGESPIVLTDACSISLADYQIYGNSVQDGEPLETEPVAIQSVGDYNKNTGQYDVPVTVRGKNYVNFEEMLKGEAWRTDASLNLNGYWHYPISGLEPNTTYTVSVAKNGFTGVNTGMEGYYVAISNTVGGWYTAGSLVHYSGRAELCRTSLTVTSSDEGKLYIAFYNPTDERLATFFEKCPNFMIELGGTATDYEPYIEPVTTTVSLDAPLRKVGDVADYIDFANGAVVRNLVSIKPTSNDTIDTYTYDDTLGVSFVNALPESDSRALGICTHSSKVDTSMVSGSIWCGVNNKYLYWVDILNILGLTTVDEFKEWLDSQEIPFEVICQRAVPVTESMDLPKLVPAFLTSTLNVDTDVLPSNISLTYYSESAE